MNVVLIDPWDNFGASFTIASTLTVNDQSCNQYYACSYGEGKFGIQYKYDYNVVIVSTSH